MDVLAVVGTCAPERGRFAARLAAVANRELFPAQRLRLANDPVQEAIDLVPWAFHSTGAVCEFPTETDPIEVIGALVDEDARVSLTGIVCVADATHLLGDLQGDQYLARSGARAGGVTEYLAHAMLTALQLEYASTIVLVNWEALSTRELSTVMALVSHLSPRARLRLDQGSVEPPPRDAPYSVGQERPGWVAVLNGEHAPRMTDRRVSTIRYEQVKPFHPARLQHLLDDRIEPGDFGTVVRSAGMCRLATRPGVVGEWEHVGHMFSLEPLATDARSLEDLVEGEREALALGQDLALIGLDLDAGALIEALDEAALTDDELAAGPAAWSQYPDPFPAWQGVAERSE